MEMEILELRRDLDLLREARRSLLFRYNGGESPSPVMSNVLDSINRETTGLEVKLESMLSPHCQEVVKQYHHGLITTEECVNALQWPSVLQNLPLFDRKETAC